MVEEEVFVFELVVEVVEQEVVPEVVAALSEEERMIYLRPMFQCPYYAFQAQ